MFGKRLTLYISYGKRAQTIPGQVAGFLSGSIVLIFIEK